MANVFISYRRSDTTSGYASWIYDRLAAALGPEHVFMDVDSLPLGVDFVEQLQRALSLADVALVLIGPGWVDARDEHGVRRIDDPDDFVRIEVAAALGAGVRVIPVLVDGAAMPADRELPDDLKALARRHALRFHRQGGGAIKDLLAAVTEIGGEESEIQSPGLNLAASRSEMQALDDELAPKTHHEPADNEIPASPRGYRIESLLRQGLIGNVYRAMQVVLDRPVALQIVTGLRASDPASKKRFLTEHRAVARVSHPNLIPIYEADEYEDGLFVATQLVEGQTLHRIVRQEKKLEPRRAAGVLAQIADALGAAHRAGIVHRDVNLINIVLASAKDASEHAYLTGFAPPLDLSEEQQFLTRSGAELVTTPAYMAPELITGNHPDPRADIYSLGCVAFHTLTGRLPFQRDSVMAMLWAHLNDTMPPVRQLTPEVPPELEEIVRTAVARDPAARFQTAEQLSQALRSSARVAAEP